MAYYGGRGDYYRGDYYRGDLFGRIGAGIKGFATGGIGGAIAGLTAMGPKKPPAPPAASIPGFIQTTKKFLTGHGGARPKKGEPGYRPRHMNPLNVKALRRADRRARSFLRITKSVVRHYTAKQPKGRAYVRASKRRK